jgi:hypothetical protein
LLYWLRLSIRSFYGTPLFQLRRRVVFAHIFFDLRKYKSRQSKFWIKLQLCLRFIDTGLSAAFRLVTTAARVGKHD